ncbi:MAG: VpsR-related response regulator [Gemmatimonadota bacterium]|nr:VpsR-related response regulator [Gemmatimonadota bacterium]
MAMLSTRRPFESRHILLVGAPDLIRPLLAGDLEQAGYEVTQVETSNAAIVVLEERTPIVTLVDMSSAALRPRELFAAAAALCPAPRVIALVPFGHERARRNALAYGAFCCLRLPVTRERLLEAVSTAESVALRQAATAVTPPSGG